MNSFKTLSQLCLAAYVIGVTPSVGDGITSDEPTVESTPYVLNAHANQHWEGAYLGAVLGYVFQGDDRVGVTPPGDDTEIVGAFSQTGFTGEILAGYRWRSGNLVFGPELAVTAGSVGGSFSNASGAGKTDMTKSLALRLKAGWLLANQDTLIFAVAGLSRASFDYAVAAALSSGSTALDDSFTTTGYVLGLGVEKQITERISVTTSVEYSNYGKTELTDSPGNTTLATPEFYGVKLGLNYSF